MKYAFIINPMSGQGKGADRILRYLEQLERYDKRDISHYLTKAENDATDIAVRLAEEAEASGEDIFIYAVGGDGTINEVANGVSGYQHAAMGLMPVGSGNDFVRCFKNTDPKAFNDVELQLDATVTDIDIIEFEYEEGGEILRRKYINGINIGLDGNTAILAHSYKNIPGVSGSFAYLLALLKNFIRKEGADLKVTVDGKVLHDDKALLCTVANGGYCGGGFESCPRFILDDGLAEVMIVKNIPRRKFLHLVPKYKAGKIFEIADIEKIISYAQGRDVTITPNPGKMKLVADGEIFETPEINIHVIRNGIRILVPQG